MGIFGVYFLICTFVLLVYYIVTIWFDLRGNKGKKKDDTETILTDSILDTESSTDVRELDGGGYQLDSSGSEDEERAGMDTVEEEVTPSLVTDDEQEAPVIIPPITPAGDSGQEDKEENDPAPSEFDRAQKIHDERLMPVERIYEEKLSSHELIEMMSRHIGQKSRIHRHRLVY